MSIATQIFLPRHGGQLRAISERYGIPSEELMDFSANINPIGPPPSVLAAMRRALTDPATLSEYPDLNQTELRQNLAAHTGTDIEGITVANGFVPLLEACLRSITPRRCLLPVPAFNEYRKVLENAGIAVIPYPLSSEASFLYDPDAILKAALNNSCDAILLANPQNPSGTICDAEELIRLVKMAVHNKITVLLDEAFIDYSPTHSLVQQVTERTNLIVFRSITKFFAIPGLRVAYAASHPSKTQAIRRYVAPWPITTLASCAVGAAINDEAYAVESRRLNEQRRAFLQTELGRLEIASYPSAANFILLQLPTTVDANLFWEEMINDHHIVLRSCANFEGLPSGYLRIAVRSEQENAKLISALEVQLAKYRPASGTPR
jgi:threonine-phosphate decarboxylase